MYRGMAIAPAGQGPPWLRRTSPAVLRCCGRPIPLWSANFDQTESNLDRAATHLTDAQAVGNCRGPLAFQDNTFGWGLINLLKAVQGH